MLLSVAAAAVLLSVAAALMAANAAQNMAEYKSQLAELTRISTLLQTQPTAELMQKQAKLQQSVNRKLPNNRA